jgi:membrane dipeptidase
MRGPVSPRARALYESAVVWDNHACPSLARVAETAKHLERVQLAGVDVLGLNVADSNVGLADLVKLAAAIRALVRQEPTRYRLIDDAEDILEARARGQLAVLLNIEGCFAMGDQLSLIQFFFDIGVRWMSMVYNRRNLVGSGVHDSEDTGLTPFGRAVVAEMDRVGMLKCCSHTGYRTAREVLEATSKATIFSHSNPRAVHDHPRNIPDDLIRACAGTGGVIALNGVGIFLGQNDVRVETLVTHIDHVVQLVGPGHVGLGLDTVFDPAAMDAALASSSDIWPDGLGYRPGIAFMQPDELPYLSDALLRRGYTEPAVRGILGENLLRVARSVWPASSKRPADLA